MQFHGTYVPNISNYSSGISFYDPKQKMVISDVEFSLYRPKFDLST
jgi:hypothetical protein